MFLADKERLNTMAKLKKKEDALIKKGNDLTDKLNAIKREFEATRLQLVELGGRSNYRWSDCVTQEEK